MQKKNIEVSKISGECSFLDYSEMKKIKSIIKNNKEMILYLFFGGLSFVVSIVTYVYFDNILGFGELVANILSWFITVMFAFLTNRIWVFNSRTKTIREFWRQMFTFYGGRVATLVLEEMILLVFITFLGCNNIIVKIFAQVMVIISNYIISKLFIFKNDK